ncbi:MAG: hypothetical protein JJE49_04990 [Peptostreptococcaceae bacterium]|nr:hypothetical protein [Peptostreptococcaceae bacterium]
MKKDWEIKKLGQVGDIIAGQSPENDELLRDFFTGNKDVALTIVDLQEKIKN